MTNKRRKSVVDIMSSLKNRTYCDCLRELRDFLVHTKLTESQMALAFSLLEELQTYGNRMEAAIYDYKDMMHKYKTIKKLETAIRSKKSQLRKLEAEEEE